MRWDREIKIAPSVMCCDFAHLGKDIQKLEQGGAKLFHFDIMDGSFVPNFTMGPDVIRALRGHTQVPFEAHLMVWEPEKHVESFVTSGCQMITVHAEACTHLHRTVQQIKDCGAKASVALNPATPLSAFDYILEELDVVLIMTVNPGFVGQRFIQATLPKVGQLKKMIQERGLKTEIAVDGNINEETIPLLVAEGANIFIGGTSGLFKEGVDLSKQLQVLQKTAEAALGCEGCE